jgi:two-component system, cell cycle response regulator
MSAESPTFLLGSGSARLASSLRPALLDAGARLEIARSAQAVLEALTGPSVPCLLLLDADVPGMPLEQLLAGIRAADSERRVPLMLISFGIEPEWLDRLAEGVIDDVVLPALPAAHWRIRIELAMRAFRNGRQLEHLRELAAMNRQTDPLTGLCNRAAMLSMLFRETDRVQRMKTPLSLMLLGVDDFEHWRARFDAAGCDELLSQVVERVHRLLRSYDLFGRVGTWELGLGLPGCSVHNAVSLAERIREVFVEPFKVDGVCARLTAGFGIASSDGRSPVVVLREAERSLEAARAAGPESIMAGSQGSAAGWFEMEPGVDLVSGR